MSQPLWSNPRLRKIKRRSIDGVTAAQIIEPLAVSQVLRIQREDTAYERSLHTNFIPARITQQYTCTRKSLVTSM